MEFLKYTFDDSSAAPRPSLISSEYFSFSDPLVQTRTLETTQEDESEKPSGFGGWKTGGVATVMTPYSETEETNDPTQSSAQQFLYRNWNINNTLSHLRNNASATTKHLCARYVWDALAAGGINVERTHARDTVKKGALEKAGFRKVHLFKDSTKNHGYVPRAGDIVVSAPDNNSSTSGHHVAMYDGSKWISDFVQSGMDVYKNKDNEWYIYRMPDSAQRAKEGGILKNKIQKFKEKWN